MRPTTKKRRRRGKEGQVKSIQLPATENLHFYEILKYLWASLTPQQQNKRIICDRPGIQSRSTIK